MLPPTSRRHETTRNRQLEQFVMQSKPPATQRRWRKPCAPSPFPNEPALRYCTVQYEVQYLTQPLTPTATTGGSASGLQGPHDAVTAGCVCVSATRVASFALDTTWMAGLFKLQERNLPVPDRPPVMGPIVNGVGSMINSIGRRAQAVSMSTLPARAAEEAAPEAHAFFFDRGGALPCV